MPFLRDNSDVRFAFVTGGKDPDEILRKGNTDDMKKLLIPPCHWLIFYGTLQIKTF